MSKFSYSLNIGDYREPVRIDITLEVANGLTPEDYTSVRDALAIVEKIGRQYEQEAIQRNTRQANALAALSSQRASESEGMDAQ